MDDLRICGHCGGEVVDSSRFCPTCGKRLPPVTGKEPPEPGPARATDRRDPDYLAGGLMVVAGVMACAGCLLPWVSNSLGDSLNGFDYAGGGATVTMLGALIAAAGVELFIGRRNRVASLAGLALSLALGAFFAVIVVGTKSFLAASISSEFPVKTGEFVGLEPGVYCALAACVTGIAASACGLARARHRRKP